MSSDGSFVREIKAHATLMPIGFLILLPLGVLIPRYARTFTNKWFYGHLGFQLFLAGPIIVAGFGLGVHATNIQVKEGFTRHLDDPHKKIGVALFILYIVQTFIGAATHFFKSPSFRFLLHRAPHQWLHFAVGHTIIWLAFYQVHLGYMVEMPSYVPVFVPPSVNKAWMAWLIIIAILYSCGLALVPRQISQESSIRHEKDSASI